MSSADDGNNGERHGGQDWRQPLQRENLSDMAYLAVRDALMRGLLKPGEKLRLRPLSE